ncbi:hypothetical protein ILYODFUR_038687 [Ilyodon furcidens]|uniref:Uncharacterized protein n=1 Tax=Ilyodon furcidens TaxID=33524 RepID=A0ABV0VC47_9TELE
MPVRIVRLHNLHFLLQIPKKRRANPSLKWHHLYQATLGTTACNQNHKRTKLYSGLISSRRSTVVTCCMNCLDL